MQPTAAAPTLSGRRSDQTGSTLVLALAVVTVILLLVVGLLGLTQTGNRSLRAYEVERTRRYAVNSALEVAVQAVRKTPDLGTTATTRSCGSRFDIPGNPRVLGSVGTGYLEVVCYKTPGAGITSGDPDTDGGQGPRDLTFEVRCNRRPTDIVQPGFLNCGRGDDYKVLAKARVRFEVDYGIAPDAGSSVSTKRAVVPKVITWEVRA
jgi:hypothetical protein